jgi:hypothetical protein
MAGTIRRPLPERIIGHAPSPILANWWFWIAQYGPGPSIPPNWRRWTLWQYTDAGDLSGIGPCDQLLQRRGDLKMLEEMFI